MRDDNKEFEMHVSEIRDLINTIAKTHAKFNKTSNVSSYLLNALNDLNRNKFEVAGVVFQVATIYEKESQYYPSILSEEICDGFPNQFIHSLINNPNGFYKILQINGKNFHYVKPIKDGYIVMNIIESDLSENFIENIDVKFFNFNDLHFIDKENFDNLPILAVKLFRFNTRHNQYFFKENYGH